MAGFDYRRNVWEPLADRIKAEERPWYECGAWTIEKLYVVGHYLTLTTNALHGSKHFSSINYVDLFCGPGIDVIRSRRTPVRYPGSPLLAAACPKPFDRILLAEADATKAIACESRVLSIATRSHVRLWNDDANAIAGEIAAAIPDRALTVVFADPFSLGALQFPTVRTLAARGRVDLIILFADRMDAGRNLEAYLTQRSSKLDDFLGHQSTWRIRYQTLQSHEPDKVRQFLVDEYVRQLRTIGYKYFRTKEIKSEAGPLYRLVYASKKDLGLKFWDIAAAYDLQGSKSLWSS